MTFVNISFSQEITMFPGLAGLQYYQDNNRISKKQLTTLMRKQKETRVLWNKSKQYNNLSYAAVGLEIGFLVLAVSPVADRINILVPLVGAVACAGASLGFTLYSNKLRKDAILTYNDNKDTGSINFGPTSNGLGLVWSF